MLKNSPSNIFYYPENEMTAKKKKKGTELFSCQRVWRKLCIHLQFFIFLLRLHYTCYKQKKIVHIEIMLKIPFPRELVLMPILYSLQNKYVASIHAKCQCTRKMTRWLSCLDIIHFIYLWKYKQACLFYKYYLHWKATANKKSTSFWLPNPLKLIENIQYSL